MALGKCYRCKTVVEPLLSDQWFVKIKPLAEPAIQAVEDGRVRIIPEAWKNNYLGWMRDIKDWCVSRQIWWGHQIPAWYCETCHGSRLSCGDRPTGPPDSVRRVRHCGENQTRCLPKGHSDALGSRPRRAGYLVLLRPLALLDLGMAPADAGIENASIPPPPW